MDVYFDHQPFLSDKFDVNAYAHALISGRAYRPDDEDGSKGESSGVGSGGVSLNGPGAMARSSAAAGGAAIPGMGRDTKGDANGKGRIGGKEERGDVGLELARLNQGIEDITKQLRQEITSSYPLLLTHLTASLSLSSHLSPIRQSLTSLSTSLDRLHTKIHVPHENLYTLVRRMRLLSQASDLSRRASRFVLLGRRLEGQMARVREAKSGQGEGEKERELAKAALSVAELDALLRSPEDEEEDGTQDQIPLKSLEFVKRYAGVVDRSRDEIIQEMEGMVINGLADLNQPLLSSSLQTAHNLRLLPDLVSNLLADLNDAVRVRIQRAFDSAAIGREVAGKDGAATNNAIKFTSRAKNATEPTSSSTQLWVSALWGRLERVVEDVANCCIKVYTLEKVLRMKRDGVTQVEFLDVVMQSLDEKPSFTFWTTLAKAFEGQTKEAARSSAWLQQALSTGYPRLLRLFHDFFAKIAVHTDTVYTREHQSPEAILVLRSVSVFETLYLSRSTTRMNETVSAALSSYLSARGNPPGPGEGVTIARTVTNELDSAKFDPLLVRTVARNAGKVLDTLVSKIDGALIKDFTATSLIGPHATPAQTINAQLVGCLYHCHVNLLPIAQDFRGKVWDILKPAADSIEATFKRITDALDASMRREFASILARIHRVDFAKPVDPMSIGTGGGSPYMQDLIDKLTYVKGEVLGRISLADFMREWVLELSRYLIRTFLLHGSIARPLGESGKLKLTGDMTELEMGIASLLTTGQVQGAKGATRIDRVGDEYMALRAFRILSQILFADVNSLGNPVETVHLPPLILLHHIIVLSPLRLPHEVHNWSEQEYVLWVQKHVDEGERLALLETAVDDQVGAERQVDGEDEPGGEGVYVRLIREVFLHARHEDASPGVG